MAPGTLSKIADASVVVAVVVMAVAGAMNGYALWAVGQEVKFTLPLGPDGGMWGLAALSATTPDGSPLPPLFPELVAALGAVIGWGGRPQLVPAALGVNAFAVGCLPAVAALGGALATRHPWLRVGAALACGLAALFHGRVGAYAWYFRPEPVAALALLGAVVVGLAYVRRPGWGLALALGAAGGLCLAAREHGVATALVLALAAPALGPRGWRAKLGAFGCAVGGIQIASNSLTADSWTTPFFVQLTLFDKLLLPIRHAFGLAAGGPDAAVGLREMPVELSQQAADGGLISVMFHRAVEASAPASSVLVAGLAAVALALVVRRWRAAWILAAGLAPLAGALFFWTEYRHFIVVLPVVAMTAVVGPAVVAERLAPRLGAVLLPLVVLATAPHGMAWSGYERQVEFDLARIQQEAEKPEARLSRWLYNKAEDGVRISGSQAIAVAAGVLPVPGRLGDSPGELVLEVPDMWWRAVVISPAVPSEGWEELWSEGTLGIYRLKRPEGVTPTCLFGVWRGPVMGRRGGEDGVQPWLEPAPGCPPRTAPTGPPGVRQ